ncbi:BolA-like protein 1 [Microdochium nivale]|nr:BolA-like protein 1 [Microdochium nivale]
MFRSTSALLPRALRTTPLPRQIDTSHRRLLSSSAVMASSPTSQTPMEDAIRSKITAALSPTKLEIYNDSHKHAHHSAMRGVTSRETHFRLVIVSQDFKGKMQPARHRAIYQLLKDEMAVEGGIHALQLRTKTPEEEAKLEDKQGGEAE